MEIHELNTFSGTLGSGDFFATDNGDDTSKISASDMFAPLNARIDNIIAGPAPSAQEVTDARVGAAVLGGVQYTSLGEAIRGQSTLLYDDISYTDEYVAQDTLNIVNGEKLSLYRGLFERNAYNPSTGATNIFSYRISARKAIQFPFQAVVSIPSGFRAYFYIASSGGGWSPSGWKTGEYIINPNTPFYLQIGRVTEDTSETANVDEFLSGFSVRTPLADTIDELRSLVNSSDFVCKTFENGGYTQSGTTLIKSTGSDRVRYAPIVCPDELVITPFKDARVTVFFTDSDGVYDSSHNINTGDMSPQFSRSIVLEDRLTNHRNYVAYIVCLASGITADNVSEYIEIKCINEGEFAYNKAGKNVNVYKFGGQGNDWCFVRTPEGYDPHRYKPYPFVICNHGNGWVMDGTEAKANWTKRTMYVPTTDPDYIANPDQYNGTNDSSLWYSNPTIEALLAAGYIVCGAENYGDNLYGNNNCRNACADFYYHMINNYNVEKRCYMIGASNGAMTSLNAAYILQGKIKAIVLQYPLTCLVNQYASNVSQQAAIRAAYGIADASITLEALAKAVATHDPLTVDVVSDTKIGTVPPVKMWYSQSDTVVNYQQNALALAELLDNSNKIVTTVEATGEHGDASHFNPAAIVAWFNAN